MWALVHDRKVGIAEWASPSAGHPLGGSGPKRTVNRRIL